MTLAAAAAAVAFATLMGGAGCASHDYGTQRPDVAQLDPRDRGLQSKDVVQASDQMAMDLLSDPGLNSSQTRWTIVVDRVENHTVNSRFDLDVFLQRLKAKLAQQGKGRVQLIENRAKYQELQNREIDPSAGDEYGQGTGTAKPAGRNPAYSLWARIDELPNRGTSYYQVTFQLSDLRTREIAWTNMYEVRVER
jgi:hypothetical protein